MSSDYTLKLVQCFAFFRIICVSFGYTLRSVQFMSHHGLVNPVSAPPVPDDVIRKVVHEQPRPTQSLPLSHTAARYFISLTTGSTQEHARVISEPTHKILNIYYSILNSVNFSFCLLNFLCVPCAHYARKKVLPLVMSQAQHQKERDERDK